MLHSSQVEPEPSNANHFLAQTVRISTMSYGDFFFGKESRILEVTLYLIKIKHFLALASVYGRV